MVLIVLHLWFNIYSYQMPPTTRYDFVHFLRVNIYRYGHSKMVPYAGPNAREGEAEPSPSAPRPGVFPLVFLTFYCCAIP